MDQAQQIKDLEKLSEMFNGEGWGLLQKDFELLLKVAQESSDTECETNDKWQFRRGNIQTLRYITNLAQITRNQLDELTDESTNDTIDS